MEIRDGLYSFVKVIDIELFIRRVQVVTVETESHENDLQPQFFFKQGTDGNASPAPDWDGRFAKGGFNGLGCCTVGHRVNGGEVGFTTVVFEYLDSNSRRSDLL